MRRSLKKKRELETKEKGEDHDSQGELKKKPCEFSPLLICFPFFKSPFKMTSLKMIVPMRLMMKLETKKPLHHKEGLSENIYTMKTRTWMSLLRASK